MDARIDVLAPIAVGPAVEGPLLNRGKIIRDEIWTDLVYLGQARKRDGYSSILVRPADSNAFDTIKSAIRNDNRLKLQVKSEAQYYEEQTKGLAGIKWLVKFVVFIMVLGAILGTMNAMFTAISSRQRELATLRALGFRRRAILFAILIESALIALLGGLAGLILALPINGISTGTTNFQTFSEVAFNFNIDLSVALWGIGLALVAGIIGGLIPAFNAARLPITTALRQI